MKATILSFLIATTLSACEKDKKLDLSLVPKGSLTCPWLPQDIRREAKKWTAIPADDLTKSDVLGLVRRFQTSETRKNLTIERVSDLYEACIKTLNKEK